MTVKRRKDTSTPRVFMHKIADIRGGVCVNVSDLGGDYLREGTPISAPDKGICHVVKTARLTSALTATGTEVKVAKGSHFKAGDIVTTKAGTKAVAIASVSRTAKDDDTITLSAALGAVDKDAWLIEAKAATTSTDSALKYTPAALVGTGAVIEADTNLFTDAWVMGVTSANPLPSDISTALKGIINL